MEKILEIKHIDNVKHTEIGQDYGSFDGYKITTDKQNIFIVISNGQCCCEDWGYLSSEDDFEDFIGADLLDIKSVDKDLLVESLKDTEELEYIGDGDAVFINIETSKGALQFVLYNSHNGYYGHTYKIISKQYNDEGCL